MPASFEVSMKIYVECIPGRVTKCFAEIVSSLQIVSSLELVSMFGISE